MRWLIILWHRRLRRIDLELFWPSCVENAADLDQAKAAFAVHAFNDNAYSDMSHDQIVAYIDQLQAPTPG